MAEMILSIPILFLLAAGAFQTTRVFLARVRFEQACGQAVREWAVGARRPGTFQDAVWASLGDTRGLFLRESLDIRSEPAGVSGALLSGPAGWAGRFAMDYGGECWTFRVRCLPSALLAGRTGQGIPFTVRMAALRHPARPEMAP